MKLLLDTHTFLWFCQDDPALSANARALIQCARQLHNSNREIESALQNIRGFGAILFLHF